MNYGDLKAAILEDSHKPALADRVPRFVRLAEGMMRRELRSVQQTASTILDDSNRTGPESGLYVLPLGLLEIRRLAPVGRYPLEQVSLDAVTKRRGGSQPAQFAVHGFTVQIRGIPPEGWELELDYLGTLAPLIADSDENALLTSHEGLYMHGALFHLYRHVRNQLAAENELQMFADAVDTLNKQAGRQLGGASVQPQYRFGRGGGY